MIVPRSLDGFNVIAAIERMLDQPELWWEAVGLFVEHFAGWEQSWQASIGDDTLERKRVHAIRSAAANIGAEQLSERARALEEALLKRTDDNPADITAELRTALKVAFRQAWAAAATARQESDFGAGGGRDTECSNSLVAQSAGENKFLCPVAGHRFCQRLYSGHPGLGEHARTG